MPAGVNLTSVKPGAFAVAALPTQSLDPGSPQKFRFLGPYFGHSEHDTDQLPQAGTHLDYSHRRNRTSVLSTEHDCVKTLQVSRIRPDIRLAFFFALVV